MSRLGQKVKDIRIKKGLSPKALAKKAGVSESFLLEVEDGTKILNENLVNRLSKILGVNLNENGDFYASVTEEAVERKTVPASAPKAAATAATLGTESRPPAAPPAPQWEQAFSAVILDVPVYDQSLSKVIDRKKLVIQGNKVEGIPTDKAFYVRIEDAGRGLPTGKGLPMGKKGDLLLVRRTGDIQNAGVYVIRWRDEIRICEVKPLGGNLLLLGPAQSALSAETANSKDVEVIGKCVRVEISL